MNQPFVELQDVCRFISGGTPSTKVPEYFMGTIPWITGADLNGNVITKARQYITEEAIQNSATNIVPKGNILLVTRTGVGKVAVAGVDICISQDFTGLELDKTKVDEWYLLYYLRSQEEALTSQQRGATIQGITRDVVETLKIPLPPLTEQKRIASLLRRADRLRFVRRTAHDLGDALLQSVFLEMFGKPEENPKGFDVFELGEIGTLDRGRSKNRPRNAPELYGGKYPFIQTGDIANAGSYISSYQQTYSDLGLKQSKMWKAGTLCITIAANIAKTAILTFDACFPDSVVGFVPNKEKTNVEYVQYWLSFKQKELEDNAPESAQKNINLEILRGLAIPVPPLSLQEEFAGVVARVESLRGRMGESERQVEGLFESLLAEAFS